MLIRVQVAGVPNLADKATWPFPTAGLVSYDPLGGNAIFDIPDADAPPNLPAVGSAGRPNSQIGPILTQIPPADMAVWKQAMSARYPQVGAAFGPTVR